MSEVMKDVKITQQQSTIDIVNQGSYIGVLADALKEKAAFILKDIQFPTTRTEAWKYTRLAKISKKKFTVQPGTIATIESYQVVKNAFNLVFINGFFSKEHSSSNLPDGITISNLASIDSTSSTIAEIGQNILLEGEVFHTLNTFFATDGVIVRIEKNAVVELPIQVLNIQTGANTISTVRNLIVAEKNSKATIVQAFFSETKSTGLTNCINEIFVKENAQLTFDKIQYESDSSYFIGTDQVEQAANSTFTINTSTLSGELVRNNLNIEVKGQNALTNLNGAYVLKGLQHVDNHTVVDHMVANCESHELYKGVINDSSTAVFNGKVFVRKDAQKINAFQSNANVLLSDNATINSKPELEIYADDVKCSHGSTTGQLDEEAVFYLRARGISEKSARKLIISAFLNDVLEKNENEDVRNFLTEILHERFEWEMY